MKHEQRTNSTVRNRLNVSGCMAVHQSGWARTVSGVLGTPLPEDLPPLLGARLDVWLSERRWRTAACPAAADTCMRSGLLHDNVDMNAGQSHVRAAM